MTVRIGQGLDVHPFVEGRPLVLGGVVIEHEKGLAGHSDADALTHAICDALLGALALGDIGQHFPDTDPQFENKESFFFLSAVRDLVEKAGWKVANIDATIFTQLPILRPYVEPMQTNLAKILRIDANQVSLKATRPEKMGALGREEGLCVMAVALLAK